MTKERSQKKTTKAHAVIVGKMSKQTVLHVSSVERDFIKVVQGFLHQL